MSVFVSDFDTYTCIHDDAPDGGHTGTIDPASIVHTTNPDGSENHNFLIVPCPVCDSVSTHPVGGGAQPALVQQLFVNKAQMDGCPQGDVSVSDPGNLVMAHVRLNCNRMDGPGRWQLDQAAEVQVETADAQSPPPLFTVAYRKTDGLVLGMTPGNMSGPVGSANGTLHLYDQAAYELLMRTDPAYIDANGGIVGSPVA